MMYEPQKEEKTRGGDDDMMRRRKQTKNEKRDLPNEESCTQIICH